VTDPDPFEIALSRQIWDSRYRYRAEGVVRDRTVYDTWRRVARALASVEREDPKEREQRYYGLLRDFRFLPGGRILAGAGTAYDVTLFNCFVMGRIGDSMEAIFDALKEGAITMQQGGGVGYDFSSLRPTGTVAWRVGGVASGPVSFMRIWDSMCATLLSTASRRGAMMATLRCDHPDIESFVDAKRDPQALRNFNLSVLVTDAFMDAVKGGRSWALVFPVQGLGGAGQGERALVGRAWPGSDGEVPCVVMKEIPARSLWDRIMRATYDTAEPGVLFVDRINRENNLAYREDISATNPCGEIPLPPYGACNLGSLNLVTFVSEPFSERARLDLEGLGAAAATAARMLDDVIDLSRFPLTAQAEQARGTRRIGLGITGLADALIMLGLHYGSPAARELAAQVMERICHTAYRVSVALARERGPFPFYDAGRYLASPFVQRLPDDIQESIRRHGIRNSHLTAIAPTGTISLFADNVSSGIEPVFDFEYRRRVRGPTGEYAWHSLTDYALRHWRDRHAEAETPDYFVDAHQLGPEQHLAMQAALQPFVDNAISKTINVPEDMGLDAFESLYRQAYDLGLKGCTSFRANPVSGSVLTQGQEARPPEPGGQCCALDREND
jgi:ribonucleoside-diphosphate reductase alpha chain